MFRKFDAFSSGRTWLVFGLLCVLIFLLFHSWVLREPFDATYFISLFERSQWSIPQSPRQMADAELYQVSGYDLWHGGDVFDINPETPPLGKYLFGASIHLIGNAYWASFGFFVLAAGLFWRVTEEIWTERNPRFLALGLFLSSPLLLAQLRQTMLDLPQLVGVLLHVLAILRIRSNASLPKQLAWSVVAGLGLSIFMGAKIGVFAPAVLIASLTLLPIRTYWKHFALMAGAAGLGYLAVYTPAFLQGLSLIEWLRAQKWIFHFYATSALPRLPWSAPLTFLTGYYSQQGDSWNWTEEWTLWWPFSLLIFIRFARRWSQLHPTWRYFVVLSTTLGLMMMAMPFFPRYAVVLYPFLGLFLTQWLHQQKPILHKAALFYSATVLLWFCTPQASVLADHLADRWQAGAHQEVYSMLTKENQLAFSRETFTYAQHHIAIRLESPAQVTFTLPSSSLWSTQTEGTARVVRQTPLGELVTEQPVTFRKEQGRWRLSWDWAITLKHFDPRAEVVLHKLKPKFGQLMTKDEIILSTGGLQSFVWVYPSRITDGERFIEEVAPILDRPGFEVRSDLYVLGEGQPRVPLGFTRERITPEQKEWLQSTPAIELEERYTRVHHPSADEESELTFLRTIEKTYAVLEPTWGGRAFLRFPDGSEQTLLDRSPIDGQDVKVDMTLSDLPRPE